MRETISNKVLSSNTKAFGYEKHIPVIKGDKAYIFLRRLISLLLGSVLFIFAMPVFVLIAIAIKLDSKGPVFFNQRRVGKGGKEFLMYKFRSMVENAHDLKDNLNHLNNHKCGRHFKIVEDPRTTRVGRILRRFSLDELPQIINVLKGDMALVGPRPPLPEEISKYSRRDALRLSVKPGITGLWQVSGRSLLPFEKCVELDLEYIRKRSIGLDLKIIIKTIPVVFSGKGAF